MCIFKGGVADTGSAKTGSDAALGIQMPGLKRSLTRVRTHRDKSTEAILSPQVNVQCLGNTSDKLSTKTTWT